MCLRDDCVSFKTSDVYHPDPLQVLLEIHGDDLLVGKVADLSDQGIQRKAYAVIEVEGLSRPVIVPVDRLKNIR